MLEAIAVHNYRSLSNLVIPLGGLQGGYTSEVPIQEKVSLLETATQICDDIWCVEEQLTIEKGMLPFGLPRFLGTLQARMTIVRVGSGTLFVHSPVAPTEQVVTFLEGLGNVGVIVAPNCQHTKYTAAYAERYPQAKVFVSRKAPKRRPNLERFAHLADDAPIPLDGLKQRSFDGHTSFETAFFHEASGTLIVSDLAYNVRGDAALLEKMWMRSHGAYGRIALPRYHQKSVFDRPAAKLALADILAWDFDRLILSHGHVVHDGAHGAFERIWSWL